MENKIVIDKDLPNLYKYLNICIVEQRGNHSICGIDDNPRKGSYDDINFIQAYINNFLEKCDSLLPDQDTFLRKYLALVDSNLLVHLTRDCQIFETGNHYVNLTFKVEQDNLIYSINFRGKFLQELNSQPIGTNVLYISYYMDYVVKNNDKSKVQDIVIRHTIAIDDTTTYYRKSIYNANLDVYDSSILELPCEYMLPESGNLIASLTPDACIIC